MKGILQFCSINAIPLLSKPYVNGVFLTRQNLCLKCCQSLEQKLCKQSVQDLSKEVLWASVGYRASKLQAVKVGEMKKKNLPSGQSQTTQVRPRV